MKFRSLIISAGLLTVFAMPPRAEAQYTADGEAYNRSYGAESMGDHRRALRELDGLTEAARKTYFYEVRRAWLLYMSGQYTDSVEAYQKAEKLAPSTAVEPQLGQMLPLMALMRWKDAMDVGLQVLKVDPKNAIALGRVGLCQYNLGRFAESAIMYQTVLGLYPSDLELRVGLGWALLKQGKKVDAGREFRRVLDVSPGYVSAQQGLAATQY